VPRTITDAQVEEVVVRTLEEVPDGATHWSKRELASRVGISRLAIGGEPADPLEGSGPGDADLGRDMRDSSSGPDTFDEQPPAMDGQPVCS
jgi:hypothetical protein